MPICCMCHEDKPEAAFAFRSLTTGERQSHCRVCHAKYRRQHYLDNREIYIAREVARIEKYREENRPLLLAYLRSHPCVDCGETDVVLLEFDHRDPASKAASVTVLALSKSWTRVMAEIEKCDVRCVVCHRRRTASAAKWQKLTLVPDVVDHPSRIDELDEQPGESQMCSACHRTLPMSEFGIKDRKSGRRRRICRSCVAAYGREHYRRHKNAYLARNRRRDRRRDRRARQLMVLRYLADHACVDCGETDVLLLEFDHRDRGTKIANVGDLIAHGTRGQLLAEIAKCDVRCVRCHRIKTATEFGWRRLGEDVTIYAYAGVA